MKTILLFLIGSYETGGKERQLTEIIKNLPADKYAVYLFMKESAGSYFGEIENNLAGYRNLNRKKFDADSFFQLGSYLSEVKPDVVVSFATLPAHMALLHKYTGFRRYRLFNMSIRDAPEKLDRSQRLESILYNCYKHVVANSRAGLEAYRQADKRGRYVLYNGLDMKRFPTSSKSDACKQTGMEGDCFNVVMVASLRKCYSKDPLTFVRAARALLQEQSIRLYLVGDGELRPELEAYAAENKITNLKFLGLRHDVEMILRASDISVLTSKTEGISNSIMEAMACGIPVIATSKGGTEEVINDGINGYLLPFGDFQAIADKIISLKSAPETLKQTSANALQTIQKNFSLEAMIQNFESIIGREWAFLI